MSLRVQAEKDLAHILENPKHFGWPLSVTDPEGNTNSDVIYGSSGDIGQVIDPELGVAVAGRKAYMSIRISTLQKQGLCIPVSIPEKDKKPWRIGISDVNGNTYCFYVIDSMPDRTIGMVTCEIGLYE